MDLTQKKLTKAEWESIEIPVSDNEKKILQVIMDGFDSVNIRFNDNLTMIQIMNLNSISLNEIHAYLYKEYFILEIQEISEFIKKFQDEKSRKNTKTKNKEIIVGENNNNNNKNMIQQEMNELLQKIKEWQEKNKFENLIKKMKKADLIRIQHMTETIHKKKPLIFEYTLLTFCKNIIESILNKNSDYGFYLYTLLQFRKISIQNHSLLLNL